MCNTDEVETLAEEGRDYERIADAVRYLGEHRGDHPSLNSVAAHVGLSAHHFQRMFRRWCGLTPKQFLSYLTVEGAKPLLDEQWPVMEVAGAVGLSGPSRLHNLFLSVEAVTPGDYKRRGADLTLRYGEYASRFGRVFMARSERGICGLEFADDDGASALGRARKRWPRAHFVPDDNTGHELVESAFEGQQCDPLPVHLNGTNFQVRVWSALLETAPGDTVGYGQLAGMIGAPKAARAVGTALGANPVGWLIPCHRVIRSVGGVGGYRWGEERKRIMLAFERSRRLGYAAYERRGFEAPGSVALHSFVT
jgi:AraC family transcriptional regulator, regulatory protein of adaptative response / methylated-DNA-[protein]-cysteine methyltransferase